MSSSTNNGVLVWGNDRGPSSHHTWTSRQQHAQVNNSSCSEPHQSHRNYAPAGVPSSIGSWQGAALPDLAFYTSVYGGGEWPGNPWLGGAHIGPLFSAPGSNGNMGGTNLPMNIDVATPFSDQAFPVVQTALPAPQPCSPPPMNWMQFPRPSLQTTPWEHPVCTVGQHGDHSGLIGSFGTEPETPLIQPATPSVTTAHSESKDVPTGRLLQMVTPHSVRPLTKSGPVPAALSTSRPRGERWDLSPITTTFRCLWTSGGTRCTALIAGDRRSVTSHLREVHDFTCDGQTIACAWGQCTVQMQRRNIPRHIVACHFEIKVTCERCGMALSRADANRKHRLACTGIVNMPAVMEGGEVDHGRLFA